MTPKIFISYRRLDSQDFTDRLFDTMANQFGAQNVFQDVGDSGKIPPGVDFVEYLAEQVRACDVVLVVIGEHWTRILQERAHRDDDFVRIEVESALSQGKIVIPVLKSATQMPSSADLPESIRKLARLNASRVRPNPDFTRDCQTLAEGIRTVYALRHRSAPTPMPQPKPVTPPPAPQSKLVTKLPSVRDILPPPFEWIEIPGGEFTMGDPYEDDYQPHHISIVTFKIAKYPVTNAQYAKFIEAGGYSTHKWWNANGWKYCQDEKLAHPKDWTTGILNNDEHPVVVSWYEAIAFANWLKEISGENVTLPTEAQWEKSARDADERIYPWGNLFDNNCCNTAENESSKTTSVKQYEGRGDSPYGVVDMVGNVWEWCLNEEHDPYLEPKDINLNSRLFRVLRGGSFMDPREYSTLARLKIPPHSSNSFHGFRLALNAR